jgi:hypothetical protein
MALEPGNKVGPYRIIELTSQGGMAPVYKAYQDDAGPYVALRVLPPDLDADPTFQRRFQDEAAPLASLRHPNILAVIDYGQADGVTYIASEWVEGEPLASRLGQPQPLSFTNAVLGPIAAALDHAHALGILHRDVKPAYIHLTADGRTLLTGFGVTRMMTPDSDSGEAAAIVGTPSYMAPEQGAGRPAASSDIYSLGVVAYEMLTGQVPFRGDTPVAVVLAHRSQPVPPPRSIVPAIPPAAEEGLLKCLSRNPSDRFRSAGDFAAALSQADTTAVAPTLLASEGAGGAGAGGQPTVAASGPAGDGPPPAAAAKKRGGRRRWIVIGAVALLVLLAGAGGAYYLLSQRGSMANVVQGLGLGNPATSPSPSPVQHQPLLFAVLQQKTGQAGQYPPAHDTVAIVDLSGDAIAKQTFIARIRPNIGPAAPLLQPEARVGGGVVFYADGRGIIRSLRPNGSTATAANIPFNNSQQELAFAVSLDGKTIDATRLTFPPVVPPTGGVPFSGPGPGPLHLDLIQTQTGGSSRTLQSRDIPQQSAAGVLQMVGWDSTGAIATDKTSLGTQQANGGRWFGEAHHVDFNGNFVSNAEFGGSGCRAQDGLPDGTVVCQSDDFRTVSVRSANAQVLWTLPSAPANQSYFGPLALSPDGKMVAFGNPTGAGGGVYAKGGGPRVDFTGQVAKFLPEGWLDNDTVIGTVGPGAGVVGEMWLFHLSSPQKPVDLGFQGNFAGVVQPAS